MKRHPGMMTAMALMLLAGCQRTEEPAPSATAMPVAGNASPRPVQEMTDYRLTETSSGVRQWVLASASMAKYASREDVDLVDVHMDFYRQGEHWSVLLADSGQVNPRTRAVHVWGKVDLATDDGRRLQTEDLHFDNVSGRITNEVFNRFTRGADVLTGIGLDATPDLDYVEVKRQVAAEVTDAGPGAGLRP